MKDKTTFAIIGCGRIGKRHAAMVKMNQNAKLLALVDNDEKIHAELKEEFSVPVFSTLQEMYNSNILPDVVNVCTPNYLHAPHAMEALKMSSNVLVEKPMTLNKRDADELISLSQYKDKQVFCVMQNRYSPPSQWLKEVVSSGVLGEIYMVSINCFWNRDADYYLNADPDYWKGKLEKDGGTLYTQFSHFIDTMYWLFGEIENISARFYDFNHQETTEFEDSGIVSFDFVKGGAGSIIYSTSVWDQNMESSISIVAEKGSVKIGGQYMNKVEHCHIKNYNMPDLKTTLPPNDYGKYQGSAANHQLVIKNVVEVLSGSNVVTTNAFEGMKVVEIIENIYQLKKN